MKQFDLSEQIARAEQQVAQIAMQLEQARGALGILHQLRDMGAEISVPDAPAGGDDAIRDD
jgi:hypothetical protein